MVVKLWFLWSGAESAFESRAVLDGSQTRVPVDILDPGFESRAVLDGSQTLSR